MEQTQLSVAAPDEVSETIARLHALVVCDFAEWAGREENREAVAEAGGRLLMRFSDEVLEALEASAVGHEDRTPAWVRHEYIEALVSLGRDLPRQVPPSVRHELAQVLQVRLLQAERRLQKPPSPSPGPS